MESWLTPTAVATIFTALLTYLGTKRSTKSDVDKIYTKEIKNIIEELKESNKTVKEEVADLRFQVKELTRKLNAKDELVAELRKEISRLEKENLELRSLQNKNELKGEE